MLGDTGYNYRSKFPEKVKKNRIQASSIGLALDEKRDHPFQQENRVWGANVWWAVVDRVIEGDHQGRDALICVFTTVSLFPKTMIDTKWANYLWNECIHDGLMHESLIVSIF